MSNEADAGTHVRTESRATQRIGNGPQRREDRAVSATLPDHPVEESGPHGDVDWGDCGAVGGERDTVAEPLRCGRDRGVADPTRPRASEGVQRSTRCAGGQSGGASRTPAFSACQTELGGSAGEAIQYADLETLFKTLGGSWKRIRRRPKQQPDPELAQVRLAGLALLEQQAELGQIDLFYGDETAVSEQGYVPYGWQFKDEDVCIPAQRGKSQSYFGLLSRDNRLRYRAFSHAVTTADVIECLDRLAADAAKPTVVVLDNASIHTSKAFQACLQSWQQRNLFIYYLPPYSPHYNIIERFWKEVKEGWLRPLDYQTPDDLFYAVNRVFSTVGQHVRIQFAHFQLKT